MAILGTVECTNIGVTFCSEISSARLPIDLTKTELRAAINAIDQWIDDAQGSFNLAIPQPARGVLTAKQKAQLFFAVARRRLDLT